LAVEVAQWVYEVRDNLNRNELQAGLVSIWKIVDRANLYIEQTKPFKLKAPEEAARLDEVLYNLVECCRIIAICLWPYLPQSAEKIFAQLGISDEPNRLSAAQWGGLKQGHTVGEPLALFPRKDQPAKK
jgi:methionyl-tRNA synthetase